MGFFNSLFGSTSGSQTPNEKNINWIPLVQAVQLTELINRSTEKPQLIFKHSTSCGISSMVIRMFESNYPLTADQADAYYLDLLSYRSISNLVADTFGVRHQSPQLLVITNGKVVAHDSHGAITDMDLSQWIKTDAV
jgi:bacillithiol system protein YtxJ